MTPDGKTIYLYRRHDEARTPILRELGRLREIAFRAVGKAPAAAAIWTATTTTIITGAVG